MRKKEIERETIPCPDFVCFHITIILSKQYIDEAAYN